MSKYQLGYAMAAEGALMMFVSACARPGDAEFSAGWCDAIYVLTEDGELKESGEWYFEWDNDGWTVAYEPSLGDIQHKSECFAHVGEFDEYEYEVMI